MFDCKKCPVHLVSFIKHHGLFVPYIVHIFDCEKCNIHLVSFIKHHGLFVPYIDDIFIFFIRKSWLSFSYIHPLQDGFSDFHPVKASPGYGDPMSNHAPEAWSP